MVTKTCLPSSLCDVSDSSDSFDSSDSSDSSDISDSTDSSDQKLVPARTVMGWTEQTHQTKNCYVITNLLNSRMLDFYKFLVIKTTQEMFPCAASFVLLLLFLDQQIKYTFLLKM